MFVFVDGGFINTLYIRFVWLNILVHILYLLLLVKLLLPYNVKIRLSSRQINIAFTSKSIQVFKRLVADREFYRDGKMALETPEKAIKTMKLYSHVDRVVKFLEVHFLS